MSLLVQASRTSYALNIENYNVASLSKGKSVAAEVFRLQKIVMDVFMRRAGGTRKCKFIMAPSLRYVTAARILCTHLKIRGDVSRTGTFSHDRVGQGTTSHNTGTQLHSVGDLHPGGVESARCTAGSV